MPGRRSSPIPFRSVQWASRAFTRVPELWPAAGWTTIPCGLLIIRRSLSSCRIERGVSSGISLDGAGGGIVIETVSPALRRYPGFWVNTSLTWTWPSFMRFVTWDRDIFERWSATARSSRCFSSFLDATNWCADLSCNVEVSSSSFWLNMSSIFFAIFSSSVFMAIASSFTSKLWAVSSILRSPNERSLSTLSKNRSLSTSDTWYTDPVFILSI